MELLAFDEDCREKNEEIDIGNLNTGSSFMKGVASLFFYAGDPSGGRMEHWNGEDFGKMVMEFDNLWRFYTSSINLSLRTPKNQTLVNESIKV